MRLTVSLLGLPATTWWFVRTRPFASKMTPDPVAVPVPDMPVVGSVSVTPSATIVTTAGLTALTMSTTEACPPAGASGAAVAAGGCVPGPAAAGACVGCAPGPAAVEVNTGGWVDAVLPRPAAFIARNVPPEVSTAVARTAVTTMPTPDERRAVGVFGAGAAGSGSANAGWAQAVGAEAAGGAKVGSAKVG